MLTWMVNRKRQLDLVNVVHPPVNPMEQQITRTRKGPCNASTAIRQHKQQQTTVVCIVGSGLSLATLGAVFVFIGTLYKSKSTPWYVAGATCIGVGLLVLLLSVETILKCRRRASLERKLERTRKESLVQLVPRSMSRTAMATNTCGEIQTQLSMPDGLALVSPTRAQHHIRGHPAHSQLSIKRSHSSPSSVVLAGDVEATV